MPNTSPRGYRTPLLTGEGSDLSAMLQTLALDIDGDVGAIVAQGTIATIPASAAANAGNFYWATDQAVLYRDSGSAWVAIGAKSDYELAFSTWKPVQRVAGYYDANTSTATVLGTHNVGAPLGTGAAAYVYVLPLAAPEFTAGSRTTQLRIVTDIIPNGTAPGVAFTIALYQPTITKPAGASLAYISALGSAVAGSPKSSAVLSLTDAVTVTGDPFTFSSSGLFAVAVTVSAGTAVNALTTLIARVQYRQV